MAYNVKVIADSVGPNGSRLTTFECTYPLIIHNELLTHRMLSRSTASNRAIPVQRIIDSVIDDPFIPESWPINQAGMQAADYLKGDSQNVAKEDWLAARNHAVRYASSLMSLGVHKQITNRLLAPWLWTTAVLSATHWANFFHLRCHEAAQPEMKRLADLMQVAYYESKPQVLEAGQWHTPYVPTFGAPGPWTFELAIEREPGTRRVASTHYNEQTRLLLVSAGQCAATSYLRQGQRTEDEAFDLAVRLLGPGHWSPFEHAAQAMPSHHHDWSGNFFGWRQLRKHMTFENQLIFQPNLPETKGQRPIVNPS